MTAPGTGQAGAGSHSTRGQRALEWWRRYCHPREGDAAARALLRRARGVTDALLVPAALDLVRRLGYAPAGGGSDDGRVAAAANLARVLAHVKEHDPGRRPMQQAGWLQFPGADRGGAQAVEQPRLSEQRFRRLLQSRRGELVLAFTRLIALLGGTVNIPALAEDFLDWDHPERGDRVRRRWAFDYWAAASAAPDEPSAPKEGYA